jgi:hypothetical protein
MTSKAKKLLDQALRLPPAEREALAGQLFVSLETDDPEAQAAWQVEIEPDPLFMLGDSSTSSRKRQ